MAPTKYRMYVDEVGNAGMAATWHDNNRYLSLTGVIIRLDHVREVVAPTIERLKQTYFESHPDDPVVLHRKELVNKRPPFAALRNPQVASAFDSDLLNLVRNIDCTVVTVTIDKMEHKQRYGRWAFHPYHYCMEALLERLCHFLRFAPGVGDVMAESRGGGEDKALKSAFRELYDGGTAFIKPQTLHPHLTSGELKVKPKSANVAGLQLADIIAHPSFRATLARQKHQALPSTFGGEIAQVLEEHKYRRNPVTSSITGWGRVWLP